MLTWKFSEHIILCKWAYPFLWICPLFRQNPQKKWRNSYNYHVIIFYLIYVNHLIENIFRTVSFLAFRSIEKLFFVLSYFRFYKTIFSFGNWCHEKCFYWKNSDFFFKIQALQSSCRVPVKEENHRVSSENPWTELIQLWQKAMHCSTSQGCSAGAATWAGWPWARPVTMGAPRTSTIKCTVGLWSGSSVLSSRSKRDMCAERQSITMWGRERCVYWYLKWHQTETQARINDTEHGISWGH